MAEQILFTEKVRNPKKLSEWIPLRRVLGNADGQVTAIQFINQYGEAINLLEPVQVIKHTSPRILEHAGIMDIVDGIEVDKYGRLAKIIINRYQLPYPSAVTSVEEPTADDTVIWINPGGSTMKKTIRYSYDEPTEPEIRLWISTYEDEGGLNGSVAAYSSLPKTSSVIVWTEDEIALQEQLGSIYTGLEEPEGDELWWIYGEQEDVEPIPEDDPFKPYEEGYTKFRMTADHYNINGGEARNYYNGTEGNLYVMYINGYMDDPAVIDALGREQGGVAYELKLESIYGASGITEEKTLDWAADENNIIVINNLNVNSAEYLDTSIKVVNASDGSDAEIPEGSIEIPRFINSEDVITMGYDPTDIDSLKDYVSIVLSESILPDYRFELTNLNRTYTPTIQLLKIDIDGLV